MVRQNQFGSREWPRVLVHGEQRVELYLLPLEDDHFVLVALAGTGERPERIKGQGPFPDASVAIGVARRIADSLMRAGYTEAVGQHWQLDAWRHRRGVLDERARTPLRTEFHPDDVLR